MYKTQLYILTFLFVLTRERNKSFIGPVYTGQILVACMEMQFRQLIMRQVSLIICCDATSKIRRINYISCKVGP